MKTDSELIASMQAGCHESFAELVTKYKDYVCRFIASILRSQQDVDEVWQQVLIIAWEKRANLSPGLNGFKFWLCGIAKNKAMQVRTRRSKRNAKEVSGDDLFANLHVHDNRQSAGRIPFLETTDSKEPALIMKQLELSLEQLPEGCRQAIILNTILNVPFHRLALLFRQPIGTIASSCARARIKMQDQCSRATALTQPVLRLEEETERLAAIMKLSPIYQQALLLRDQGLSYKDIAERLNCSVSVVGVRILKAKKKLLEQLKKPVSVSGTGGQHEKDCLKVAAKLSSQHRSVLDLVHDCSYKEIAKRLRIKIGTVQSRLAIAYRRIADEQDIPVDEVKDVFRTWWRLRA